MSRNSIVDFQLNRRRCMTCHYFDAPTRRLVPANSVTLKIEFNEDRKVGRCKLTGRQCRYDFDPGPHPIGGCNYKRWLELP